MNKIDYTYEGKLNCLLNITTGAKLDIRYTIDGNTGKPTTVSILINPKTMDMITFNYQELKEIVGDKNKENILYGVR